MYFDDRRHKRLDSTTVNKRLDELEQLMVESWKRKVAKRVAKALTKSEHPDSPVSSSPD